MPRPAPHKWAFLPRFRCHAFGWKSQPAVLRVRQAVAEIQRVARRDALLAGDGAVRLLEKLSPAIEQVDSSSGSIGSAVMRAVHELAAIIAAAPAGAEQREEWLERLWQALEEDQMPYIEDLTDHWGELCATPERAGVWADRLLPGARAFLRERGALHLDINPARACLSALFSAGRQAELLDLLGGESFWSFRRWGVRALAASGRIDEALALAESAHSSWADPADVHAVCEQVLLAEGRVDDAYRRFGLRAHARDTYLAWFTAVRRAYPDRPAAEILADLVAATPGSEGKWFAAARKARLFEVALELSRRSPCDPRTLTRAARDHARSEPEFALGAGLAALHWLAAGHGYEITGADIREACEHTLQAAARCGALDPTRQRMRALVSPGNCDGTMRRAVEASLDSPTGHPAGDGRYPGRVAQPGGPAREGRPPENER